MSGTDKFWRTILTPERGMGPSGNFFPRLRSGVEVLRAGRGFAFTLNLSQVGTLKIRGTFRAKNRQQPHSFLVCCVWCTERGFFLCVESASFFAELYSGSAGVVPA